MSKVQILNLNVNKNKEYADHLSYAGRQMNESDLKIYIVVKDQRSWIAILLFFFSCLKCDGVKPVTFLNCADK